MMRLDERYQPPLSVRIAIDISLGGLDGTMTRKELYIAERPSGFMDGASGSRNEGASTGMRGAPIQP